jgi:flagellar M-ring protein FliF
LAGLLVVLVLGVRPALRGVRRTAFGSGKSPARELSGATAAQPQAALRPAEPVEVDPERQRAQEIFEQVSTHLKREPSQSSRLLQSWFHSD